MEQQGCQTLTTQSLERRFKPLKPVLARAHPHEAILALATTLQVRAHRTHLASRGFCWPRVKTCLLPTTAATAHVRSLHLPAATIIRHIRYLTIDFAPTWTSVPAGKSIQPRVKTCLGHRHHTRNPASTPIFAHVQVSRSLPPAPSMPTRGAKIVQVAR